MLDIIIYIILLIRSLPLPLYHLLGRLPSSTHPSKNPELAPACLACDTPAPKSWRTLKIFTGSPAPSRQQAKAYGTMEADDRGGGPWKSHSPLDPPLIWPLVVAVVPWSGLPACGSAEAREGGRVAETRALYLTPPRANRGPHPSILISPSRS